MFLFLSCRNFAQDFATGFSLVLVGEKCPEKSSTELPRKIVGEIDERKAPIHFCGMVGAIDTCHKRC